MIAQQMNLDVIANNLSNVNTTAFKGQTAQFQDMMYQTYRLSGAATSSSTNTPGATQVGLGSAFTANTSDLTPGAVQQTNSPLDLAINGNGYFQVQRPDGIAYTRDGSFQRDANGLVVTTDGYPLVPEITVPAGASAVNVSANGVVNAVLPGSTDPQQIGTIQLATFLNPGGLTRMGQNLYLKGGASGDAATGTPGENNVGALQSGYLEGSNVSVVNEMVKMISAQRSYEINSKAIQASDEMLQTVNGLKR
jgi:flagellar basal-body rod protein FlgG